MERVLARLALAKTYGKNEIIWSGPRIKATETSKDSIIVTFNQYADGLKTTNGDRLLWFEIASSDGVFHPAIADIKGLDKVVVWNPVIKHPVKSSVRMA